MKSNVRLLSNIHLHAEVPRHVHGREALRKFLDSREIFDVPGRAERHLTSVQLQEWLEENRCSMCKTVVNGPVRRGGVVRHEFRCPHGKCPYE